MLLEIYYPYLIAGIIFILAVVSFLVTLFTKKSVTHAVKNFEEVITMGKKYLTVDTRSKTKQVFSEEVPDYVLSERTNELELSPIPKNIQDYINSHIETALERALERFSVPNAIEQEDVFNDYTQRVDDLSSIGEAIELAETYRDRYHLPDTYSISDIYSFVDKQAKDLGLKLKEVSNVKKEKIENEDK